MTRYRFQAIPASATAVFDCPSCGKSKRKRTFRAECTVNPFNTNDDGTMKSPREVWEQSRERAIQQRDEFMRRPLCATCENALSWTERRDLSEDRRAKAEAVMTSLTFQITASLFVIAVYVAAFIEALRRS